MAPYIEILGRQIPTYGLLALVGMLLSGWFAEHQAVKHGEHPFYMIETLLIALIGTMIGGHGLYAITNLKHVGEWSFLSLFGGMVYFGGLYGGLAAGYAWARYKKYRIPLYADLTAMALPLFHTFGRIGCFFGGCCYGIPWEHGILYYSREIPADQIVRRFPVQLLESALVLALFLTLYFFFYRVTPKSSEKQINRTNLFRGHLLEIYLASYSVIRFLDEFLRGDEIRGHLGPFSTSQWIALVTLIVLAIIRVYKKQKNPM
ncbi:MAG: prolipoprotein diacylglyceryl transferase [Firmicutes bacterium]|nr:prolipoprotein diacylglyceryl transferase [Bacillota bacterium]